MIAAEMYHQAVKLRTMFPSLDVLVVRSGTRYRTFIVGVRPKESDDDMHIWMADPIDGFPSEALQLKLSLIA